MRGHRISEIVYRPENGVHGGVESESVIGVSEVVIYRAGDTDDVDSVFVGQTSRAGERTVAADDHKSFDAEGFKVIRCLFSRFGKFEFKTSRRFENGAAPLNYIAHRMSVHLSDAVVYEAVITSFHAENFQSAVDCASYARSDAGVHTRRVAAACENCYFFHKFTSSV